MYRLFIFVFLFGYAFCGPRPDDSLTDGEAKIMGGTVMDIKNIPFLVSVQFKGKHLCGGSLINSRFVLTAAHCLYGRNTRQFRIRAGSNYHSSGGEVRSVSGVTMHPQYNDHTSDNDIAILELIRPVTSIPEAKILPLATEEPKAGESVLLAGWGASGFGGVSSSYLQSVVVHVIDKTVCKRKYLGGNPITKNMWCAGTLSGGRDACQGDSGGSAIVNGRLAGIISWGKGCGNAKFPGVYTTISNYLPWINVVINK